MTNEQLEVSGTQFDVDYRRKKNKEEMKLQLISFVLMILLTFISFIAVGSSSISLSFTIPFILLLACVQVVFQLFYFMHMNEKGHLIPKLFIFGGVVVTFVTILTYMTIIWW